MEKNLVKVMLTPKEECMQPEWEKGLMNKQAKGEREIVTNKGREGKKEQR